MNTMKRLFLCFGLLFGARLCAAETARATASPNGRYVFVMVPAGEDEKAHPAHGTLYEVSADGSLKAHWTTKGWYAPDMVVANDGAHIIALNTWPEGDQPDATIGVAFYRSGKLVKSYAIRDLVKEKEAVRGSFSHYRWLAEHPTQQPRLEEQTFRLITIDGTLYNFDLDSGAITKASAVRLFRK
ncbi:MAG TPA: hypothetical protein VFT72_17480 [Opitutaceae bacterium]|nr:hypothetical protein [Opitutaceae bacterium]